ncbi:MAG: hypothetical protein AAGG80_05595 [Pseudomonadota bacterium]
MPTLKLEKLSTLSKHLIKCLVFSNSDFAKKHEQAITRSALLAYLTYQWINETFDANNSWNEETKIILAMSTMVTVFSLIYYGNFLNAKNFIEKEPVTKSCKNTSS